MSTKAARPDWRGRTVAVLASGPSLTQEDCDAAHAAGCVTIATNTTFRRAPWATALFGWDSVFWKHYHAEIEALPFRGLRFSATGGLAHATAEILAYSEWFAPQGNSGASSISLAVAAGAKRILLLGCDCKHSNAGAVHWHGDHPAGLTNAPTMNRWPLAFSRAGIYAKDRGVEVINCTRDTALACFPRVALEDALASVAA